MSLPALSPAVRANPGVQGMLTAFDRNKSRMRELSRLAKGSQTPIEQVLAATAGAATSAGCVAFFGKRNGRLAAGALGLLAVAGGAVYEEPRAVTFGISNWVPFIHNAMVDQLTKSGVISDGSDSEDDSEDGTVKPAAAK